MSKQSVKKWGLIAVSVWGLSAWGCASSSDVDQLRTDMDMLRVQQESLKDTLGSREATMAEMIAQARKENESLRELIAKAQETLQKNDAETGTDLQRMRTELNELRGSAEELDFKLAKMEQDIKTFKEDVDLRLQGAVNQMALPENATELLQLGKDKIASQEWRDARKAFEAFISRHGEDSRMDEAIYYLGETYFFEKQYILSIYEYQKIVKNYAKSSLNIDAVFRIGQAFKNLKRCSQAQPFFEAVIADDKKSTRASQARKELASCK